MIPQLQLVSLWRAYSFLVLSTIASSFFLTSCTRKTSVQLAEKTSPGWKAQILQVSEPSEAMVLRQEGMGGPPIGIPAPPSEKDKKWLVVKVSLTPPPAAPKASPSPAASGIPGGVLSEMDSQRSEEEERPALKFASIQLVSSNGDAYPAEAVSTGATWKGTGSKEVGEFVDPKNSEPIFKDNSGRLLMGFQVGWLTFFRRDAQEVAFLFAVPKGAPTLSLRF